MGCPQIYGTDLFRLKLSVQVPQLIAGCCLLASYQFQRAMIHFANALHFQSEVLIRVRVSPYLALYKEGVKQSLCLKEPTLCKSSKTSCKSQG